MVRRPVVCALAAVAALLMALRLDVRAVVADEPGSPAVQMLVPGFTVRELPLELPNINNVRYRADGKLVALGYNGNVYLLSDTDGDGLEDRARVFWDNQGRLKGPIGLALTPPGYEHGDGAFVPNHSKLSLVVDTDGDDRADKEIVVATGWPPMQHSVDAFGVAFDRRDGSVYFGLGTGDYTNAYRTDDQGHAHYDLAAERGTILRVAPDLKSREIVCTGIRFSVALAFDRHGELFCTDQEGATWLANGNPFDELLHIRRGKHYGFPPRHPDHLPSVVDEPSVYDYGPQHQSTCGLAFNEPVGDGSAFGPDNWRGDALVCGYSRGKLYRTKLARTPAGYTAQNQILAGLNMLTADACVAPDGGLVVAAHSGGPDWGSGPDGPGKLFKIDYTDRDVPQPVLAYATEDSDFHVPGGRPSEVRVAFDRPLDESYAKGLAERIEIEFGQHVRAGDRFETLRPGYAVVAWQQAAPRFRLNVESARLSDDRRTVIIKTAPHAELAHYAVTLPRPKAKGGADGASDEGALVQSAEIDLDYDLSGVSVRWEPGKGSGETVWDGWLPHVDLGVARTFTAGSSEHEALWQKTTHPGTLMMSTVLDLTDLLRPAVQPGSTITYELPPEEVTLRFRSKSKFTVSSKAKLAEVKQGAGGVYVGTLVFAADAPKRVDLGLAVFHTGGELDLAVSYSTAEDASERTLPLGRLLQPSASDLLSGGATLAARAVPEIQSGDWARGRALYFSERAGCAKCHSIRGQGEHIGPDLTNVAHRDYASVLRDIREPSYAINPEFITFTIALTDGRVLKGPVRTVDGLVHVGNEKGEVTAFNADLIDQIEPAKTSIMPEGVDKELSPQELTDLMTFLLVAPVTMPQYAEAEPPQPRRRAEVDAVLADSSPADGEVKPLNIVLVAGRQDHGVGEHDYPAFQKAWHELLSLSAGTSVSTAWDWPSDEQLKTADVLVFYQRGDWNPDRAAAIDTFLARGGGLIYIHWAVDGGKDAVGFAKRIGLACDAPTLLYRHGPLDLDFAPGKSHPIARNFDRAHFYDESYWRMVGDATTIDLLATGDEEGQPQPLFWTIEQGRGRVFVSILGHYSWTFDDPLYRALLLRAMLWTAREPVDRFNHLVTIGARISDE